MVWNPSRPDARRDAATRGEAPQIFEGLAVASWRPHGGRAIAFPATSIRQTGGNRIVERERPYRRGAKLDSTGRRAFRWTVEAVFNNTIVEPGLDQTVPLYPNTLNKLIASFDVQRTGDLTLPTTGLVRAMLDTDERVEVHEFRDSAALTMTFIEDNEDGVDAAAFTPPSIAGQGVRLSQETEFSAQEAGAWDGSVQDLKELAANLEGLANAPDNVVQDLEGQARVLMAACDRVLNVFSDRATQGRSLFVDDPDTVHVQRKVGLIKEGAGQTRTRARQNRPQLTTVVFENTQSLASIAAMLHIDLMALLVANPQLPNPLCIPRGTQVRIPHDGAITRQG